MARRVHPAGPVAWVRRHDPEGEAAHRALRVALVATTVLAVTDLGLTDPGPDSPQVITFGVFGVFALLLFAEFPGTRSARAASFGLLAAVGAVFITLGTLVSTTWWAASLGMVAVGVLVVFSGVLSAAFDGGTRAALLTFILPATVPAGPGDIPDRLLGWGLALALAVPAALFLWPPAFHDRMRQTSAAACAALADRLRILLGTSPPAGRGGDAGRESVVTANAELRRVMRASTARPVGMTTGSRLLLRVADQVDWLRGLTGRPDPDTVRGWPEWTREVVTACAEVLAAAAAVLPAQERTPAHLARLHSALDALSAARDGAARRLGESLGGGASTVGDVLVHAERRAQLVHEWAYACHLLGRTVRDAAAADARPLWHRLLGRDSTALAVRTSRAVRLLTVEQAGRHSVALQNALRAGLGLGLAVLIAQTSHVQHGFWVALGAMSVLRTSAVTTTSTAARALLGTLVGFVVGACVLLLVGTGPVTLWLLLPPAVLVAGFAPATLSVATGQGAFTVAVLVLFNILQPVGWTLGLIRVEDVALGCAASLVVGWLMWPRGAAGLVRRSLAETYPVAVSGLVDAADNALQGTPRHPAVPAVAPPAVRLEGALRQYLGERARGPLRVEDLSLAANGIGRLRLATEALETLPAQGPAPGEPATAAPAITAQAAVTRAWYARWADGLTEPDIPVPPPPAADLEHRVVTALLAEPPERDRPTSIRRALQLTWAALYLDDAARLAHTLAGLPLGVSPGPTDR